MSAIKTAHYRLTHAEILALPTVPIRLTPVAGRGAAVLFIVGRVVSHIVTPYEGFSAGQGWLTIRSAAGYDESTYVMNDPSGAPDNPTYLESLLSESNEFGISQASFLNNATYQTMNGMWLNGDDYQNGLFVGITNGNPSVNLSGGHARNHLDVMAVYAQFSL